MERTQDSPIMTENGFIYMYYSSFKWLMHYNIDNDKKFGIILRDEWDYSPHINYDKSCHVQREEASVATHN